jgi:hypothetical protein
MRLDSAIDSAMDSAISQQGATHCEQGAARTEGETSHLTRRFHGLLRVGSDERWVGKRDGREDGPGLVLNEDNDSVEKAKPPAR